MKRIGVKQICSGSDFSSLSNSKSANLSCFAATIFLMAAGLIYTACLIYGIALHLPAQVAGIAL